MRHARVYMLGEPAAILREEAEGRYLLVYDEGYSGPPISLTMPVQEREFSFDRFPPFFEGLLPEGVMLDSLLLHNKLDRTDLFAQLLTVGADMVGAVTVSEESQ
jgi:serine/threonine-protein kinase HipA